MARIPQAELDRLNAEVSLERLAEARGVKLVKKGADLHGRCPFHDDRTPSLVITPEKNLWNCLGACQEGGDVIKWVQKAEGVSFRHAVEILREGLPSLEAGSETARPVVKASTVQKLSKLADSTVEDQVLLRRVVEHYHESLKNSPDALGYLQSRGLNNPELVTQFRLGFSDRTLGYKLPEGNRKEGGEIRGRLRRLGILRKSGHEHLRGSLVVPLYDAAGKLVQLYGRKVTRNLRAGTPDHLYLPGPLRGVFNLDGIRGSEEVILCESLIDAMTFWVHGIRNVTTALGVGVVTPETWEAFETCGVKRVLLAFDRDEAGDVGAKKLAGKLQEKGIDAYRVRFPQGMDVNEYAEKTAPAGPSLAQVLRHAIWMGEGEEPANREKVLVLDGLDLDLPELLEVRGAEPELEPETVASDAEDSPLSGLDLDEEVLEGVRQEASGAASKEEALVPAPESEPVEEPMPERVASTPPVQAPAMSSAPAAAYRIPPVPAAVKLIHEGVNHWVTLGDRKYRIRDLLRNSSPGALNVNLFVSRETVPAGLAGFHVDTLNLYLDKPRGHFAKRAAQELGLEETAISRDLGKLLLLLETELEEAKQREAEEKAKPVEISETEKEEALAFLRDPHLLDQILADFNRCGVVGEEVNKLVGYVAGTSRKLRLPLGIIIQSNSAAGKSSLMDSIVAFMPEEECVVYSAMTGQSLYYIETELAHKILAVAEEEGAQKASYSLKLLQSEGVLTIASTTKDPMTGRQSTKDYEVEGPVMVFLTTTATDTDEELLNRCLILTVDESREQTRAIHKIQRERQTLEGLLETQEREQILQRHRNAQRLLRPLPVVNPYANKLTFQDHQTRMRRDHMKYLTLISAIAFLHQYQREVKTARTAFGEEVEYIEVTKADIQVANRLAREVLGSSLDELPPQARKLLAAIVKMVKERCEEQGVTREEYRFTRKDVRDFTGVGNTQMKKYLATLEDLEYLLVHSGGRGQMMVYELLHDGDMETTAPYFPGLLELGEPTSEYQYDTSWSAEMTEKSAPSRVEVGRKSAGWSGQGKTPETSSQKGLEESQKERNLESLQKGLIGRKSSPDSAVNVGADRVMDVGERDHDSHPEV